MWGIDNYCIIEANPHVGFSSSGTLGLEHISILKVDFLEPLAWLMIEMPSVCMLGGYQTKNLRHVLPRGVTTKGR